MLFNYSQNSAVPDWTTISEIQLFTYTIPKIFISALKLEFFIFYQMSKYLLRISFFSSSFVLLFTPWQGRPILRFFLIALPVFSRFHLLWERKGQKMECPLSDHWDHSNVLFRRHPAALFLFSFLLFFSIFLSLKRKRHSLLPLTFTHRHTLALRRKKMYGHAIRPDLWFILSRQKMLVVGSK